MKIVLLAGKQAGCIGLLTLLASGHSITSVFAYDTMNSSLASRFGIPVWHCYDVNLNGIKLRSIKDPDTPKHFNGADMLISIHGREIVPYYMLLDLYYGGINVHPCLYAFKGAHPIERLLKSGNSKASVGVHRMTQQLDEGEVLAERFVDITGCKTPDEVYNRLYPYYSHVLLDALNKLVSCPETPLPKIEGEHYICPDPHLFRSFHV